MRFAFYERNFLDLQVDKNDILITYLESKNLSTWK